jgi:hypothetical protein
VLSTDGGVLSARAFQGSFAITRPGKDREVWFSLEENHEKAYRSPDFLQRGTR